MRGLVPVLLISVVLIAACTGSAKPGWTYAPAASSDMVASVGSAAPPAEPAVAAAPAGGTIAIDAFDLGFTPAQPTVDAPGRYTVELTNTGSAPHDITFPDGTQVAAGPGETASVEVDVPAAGLAFICSIPGHEQGGMTGTIGVTGGDAAAAASPEPSAASHDDHGGPAPVTDVAADPNAPAPVVHDPAAPDRLEGEVHDIDLVMTEQEMTVAPGFVQKVWTFGGTVPGPVIRVKVGDTIRVHLKNPAENEMAHSIDFHSSQVAWNDEMRSIAPGRGARLRMDRRLRRRVDVPLRDVAGAPPHRQRHVRHGHRRARGRACRRSTRSSPLVQSEWYLGPQGEVVDLTKAMAAAPAPDYVVFNGVANQYQDAPLADGDREPDRFFVLDAGPSIDSSFHIVGTIFDTVIKEGVHARPRATPGTGGRRPSTCRRPRARSSSSRPRRTGSTRWSPTPSTSSGAARSASSSSGDGDPAN